MSQIFDTVIQNTNIKEYNTTPILIHKTDSLGDINDHISLFIENLGSLYIDNTFSISTSEEAKNSMTKIEKLKVEIQNRKNTLNALKKALTHS